MHCAFPYFFFSPFDLNSAIHDVNSLELFRSAFFTLFNPQALKLQKGNKTKTDLEIEEEKRPQGTSREVRKKEDCRREAETPK